MGRSNGYRPTKAQKKVVDELRLRLGQTRKDDWQKARCLMQEIAIHLGVRGGPMGGQVNPRACKYCHYYGHTKQWCPKRVAMEKEREEKELDELLQEARAEMQAYLLGSNGKVIKSDPVWDKWLSWAERRECEADKRELHCHTVVATCASEAVPCESCEGCKGWVRFCEEYERVDPEPPRTSERGACT